MDVQTTNGKGRPLGRLVMREVFSQAENRGAALVYAALSLLFGFLFSRAHAVFSAYPFGIALLAVANRRIFFVFAGTLLGALSIGERGYAYCAVLVAVLLLRLLLSYPREGNKYLPASSALFREPGALRLATACVASAFPAIYELSLGGLSEASIAYAVTMATLPTLAAFTYLYFYESGEYLFTLIAAEQGERGTGSWRLPLSLSAFAFTLLLSLRGVTLLGISLPLTVAAVLSFVFAARLGLLRALAATALFSLGTLSPALLPAYVAMAAVGALFFRMGVFSMLVAATAAGEVLAFLLLGVDSVISFLPEAVVAMALAYPILFRLPQLFLLVKGKEEKAKTAAEEQFGRRREPSDRLCRLAAAYADMQGVFTQLAAVSARPSEAEYYAAARRVFEGGCASCALCRECHEKGGKEGKKALLSLSAQGAGGVVAANLKIPDNLLSDCRIRARLLDGVRESFAELERNKKRGEPHARLAEECRMQAEVLTDAARAESRRQSVDAESTRRVLEALATRGATAGSVAVFGDRKKQLYIKDLRFDEENCPRTDLLAALEKACSCRFKAPVLEAEVGGLSLFAESEPRFSLTHVRAGHPRGGEISGDTFSAFEGEGEHFYALLSDGMGSGREAAITSGISGAFLRGMLSAGMSCDTALASLNGMLGARGSECSATVDLLSVDLFDGRAFFIKSGAAVSYVRRGDSLFRIRASTAPIGILPALDAKKTEFSLQAGDVVVMLSDGVCGTPEDAFWLCELLTAGWEEDTELMADKILSAARRENEAGDDMTVALLSVKEVA